jgi:hypothetical protein
MVEFLKVDNSHDSMNAVDSHHKENMTKHADDELSLDHTEHKVFMTGFGMLGWLVSCIRGDLACTYSMIASDMANPTKLQVDEETRLGYSIHKRDVDLWRRHETKHEHPDVSMETLY